MICNFWIVNFTFIIVGINLPRPNFTLASAVLLKIIISGGHTHAFDGIGDIFLNVDHSKACLEKWKS